MRTFYKWLLAETTTAPFNWNKTAKMWIAFPVIDGIRFQIDFWESHSWQGAAGEWQVSFYQVEPERTDWAGKIKNDIRDAEPVSMTTIIELFQGIENGLMELFQNPGIITVKIHPEATETKRKAKIQKVNDKLGFRYSQDFDLPKFNAYQMLFQHSQLHASGFTMRDDGEYLIISRPTPHQWAGLLHTKPTATSTSL